MGSGFSGLVQNAPQLCSIPPSNSFLHGRSLSVRVDHVIFIEHIGAVPVHFPSPTVLLSILTRSSSQRQASSLLNDITRSYIEKGWSPIISLLSQVTRPRTDGTVRGGGSRAGQTERATDTRYISSGNPRQHCSPRAIPEWMRRLAIG